MKHLLVAFFAILTIYSCKPEELELVFNNDDNSISLKVQAKRSSPMDPYMVNMIVNAKDKTERNMKTEIFASAIDNETVSCVWEEGGAVLVFKQTDGSIRSFKLDVNEKLLHLREVKLEIEE